MKKTENSKGKNCRGKKSSDCGSAKSTKNCK